MHYLAPEMLLDASTAKGEPADVYSLARVLWTLAAGQTFPMPGHLHRDFDQLRLSSFVAGMKHMKLDAILHATTHPDPTLRPTMRTVVQELDALAKPSLGQDTTSTPTLPSWLVERLEERSGGRERMEQQQIHEEFSRLDARMTEWLKIRFGPVMDQLAERLRGAPNVEVRSWTGRRGGEKSALASTQTPADRDVQDVGPQEYWESDIGGSIKRNSGTYIDFVFGVSVGVPSVSKKGFLIPVDSRPLELHGGYVCGHLPNDATHIWSDSASFILGGPEEEHACARIEAGLRDHFVHALENLVERAEAT